jgi:uncharacterized membrane protein
MDREVVYAGGRIFSIYAKDGFSASLHPKAANRRLGNIEMQNGRLNAFSDGVIAIIITIMVLELKVPHGDDLGALWPLAPVFLSYVLSFIYIAIYWNNHHHLMHTSESVDGRILWANMNLLFWLSLIPFATGWLGENHFAVLPSAVYGCALLMPAIAYYILQMAIVHRHGQDGALATAIGKDYKAKLSLALYAVSIGLAFVQPWISQAIWVTVALMWLVPDMRIAKTLQA